MTIAGNSNTDETHHAALPAELAELAGKRLQAIAKAFGAVGLDPPKPHELPGDYARVLATSSFVAQSCERQPAMLRDLIDSGDLASSYATRDDPQADDYDAPGDRGFNARVHAELDGLTDEEGVRSALRRLRRREWVRIAWRDIGGVSGYDETVADLSAFADASIAAALDYCHGALARRFGEPTGPDGKAQALLVLALGKLGARELNFSSDVDLIFAFPSAGETTSSEASDAAGGSRRSLSNDEFFQRLAQALINCLSAVTEDGYVFRVDMRLRPFGTGGPLVCTYGALETYYETHGRDWERYALIRARVVAGDRAGGEALLENLAPFVYRRYLDFGTLASLRDMKQMIAREVTRRGLENNVKLGAGGIREIEFTGQAFQMVRGGRSAALRERRILVVLDRLAELDLLPRQAADELITAYRFLRDVEHRLQQAEDAQTHTLPEDEAARERLAAAMGHGSWQALSLELTFHRNNVSTHFHDILEGHEGGESESLSALGAVIAGTATEEEAAQALSQAGFADGAAAAAGLRACLDSPAARGTDATGRERLERLLPSVVETAAAEDEAQLTLERMLKVMISVARRSAYLSLLYERPAALQQLAHLCGTSKAIASEVTRFPQLLDQLLDPTRLYAPLERAELESDLDERFQSIQSGDTEAEMEVLRQFRHSHALRVAASDAMGAIDVAAVADRLSDIAEAVLERCTRIAWRDIATRHGEPPDGAGGFAVIAYGKLGGIELGYGSDLDLVFVHVDLPEGDPHTTGAKPLHLQTFYSRVAQRLIHFLTTYTPSGRLYEVDARLRPQGGAGLLVTSESALNRYLRDEAWTWELQALLRARPVAGDPALMARMAKSRLAFLAQDRDAERLRTEVRDMRARMLREHASREPDAFRVKRDDGGMVDIEFVVQYLALKEAGQIGPSLERTGTLGLLSACVEAGAIDAEDAALLHEAFDRYRTRVNRLALNERDDDGQAPQLAELAAQVSRVRDRVLGVPEP